MNLSSNPHLEPVGVPAELGVEKRTLPDRRETPTSAWAALPPAGQRLKNRRADEHRRPYFVDRFSSATLLFIVMLLIATIVDAVLTIHLLRAGAEEINPLMDHVLDHGIRPFLLIKYVLTAGGLPLLLIFQNHYLFGARFRVGYLIPMVVAMYAVLISYQLVLIYS
jgi:hypothetical protein